jgi:hypothetical protein
MLSPISGPVTASATQHSNPAPAPSTASTASQSSQLPQDTVSISSAGQKAASADVDHDGDSH